MLMKCGKCGYENQLNAIFCRGCGEKIDPAEVTPETLAEEAAKKKEEQKKINWWPIVGLILLALVVTYGIMLFTTPSGSPTYQQGSSVSYKAAWDDIQDGYTTTVTPEQMTAFFNEILIDKDAAKSGNSYALKDVIFTGNGNLLTLTIHTNVLTCNATLTVTGRLKKGTDRKPIQFDITDFQFGNTSLFLGRDSLLKHFDNVFYAEVLQEVFRNATDVSFADGKLYIVQKEKVIVPPEPKKKTAPPKKQAQKDKK